MFSDFSSGHHYNLRTTFILENTSSNKSSGDKCIRHYLPALINKTKADILDKTSTHSIQGFSFYVKRLTLADYRMECVERDCYVCKRRS